MSGHQCHICGNTAATLEAKYGFIEVEMQTVNLSSNSEEMTCKVCHVCIQIMAFISEKTAERTFGEQVFNTGDNHL